MTAHEKLKRNPDWTWLLLFLLLSRIVLIIPLLIGANLFFEQHVSTESFANPKTIPGAWARWDSGYYLSIADHGYSADVRYRVFFPLYPLLIHLFGFGSKLGMTWAGFLLANIAFILACVLFFQIIVKDHNRSIAWATIITLNLYPTSFFFSAIYTESLFLLLSLLVYWFSRRGQYYHAALMVSLASLTRINGLILAAIPIVEILLQRTDKKQDRITKTIITGIIQHLGYFSMVCFYSSTRKTHLHLSFLKISISSAMSACRGHRYWTAPELLLQAVTRERPLTGLRASTAWKTF